MEGFIMPTKQICTICKKDIKGDKTVCQDHIGRVFCGLCFMDFVKNEAKNSCFGIPSGDPKSATEMAIKHVKDFYKWQ